MNEVEKYFEGHPDYAKGTMTINLDLKDEPSREVEAYIHKSGLYGIENTPWYVALTYIPHGSRIGWLCEPEIIDAFGI